MAVAFACCPCASPYATRPPRLSRSRKSPQVVTVVTHFPSNRLENHVLGWTTPHNPRPRDGNLKFRAKKLPSEILNPEALREDFSWKKFVSEKERSSSKQSSPTICFSKSLREDFAWKKFLSEKHEKLQSFSRIRISRSLAEDFIWKDFRSDEEKSSTGNCNPESLPEDVTWKKSRLKEGKSSSGICNPESTAEDFTRKKFRSEKEQFSVRGCNFESWSEEIGSRGHGVVWRKVKEVAAAVVLSALISLPVGDCDYTRVLASEAESGPGFELGSVLDPQCTPSSNFTADSDTIPDEEAVSNESVVAEAWQVVNSYFLDARHHSWSEEEWMKLKADVMKRPFRSKMAEYGAIKGMLATLRDPYTRFLTPDQFRELAKYDVSGIGVNIGEVDDEKGGRRLSVLGIVIGSPAQMMGVRQGDELVSVNGKSVQGMSAFEAASLIQGLKGTPVSIDFKQGPCETVKNIIVARQQDVRTPVFYRLERTRSSSGSSELTGYIRLKEFNALAKKDLVIAMRRLEEAGATSFLLDLQDNPGGLVQAGIEIARLFLDGGETVIQTVGRDPTNYKSILATGAPFTKAPLMVLVNNRTASASEIVAAALHDNCRAILVGNRTFGKGLIQSVYELSDGSGLVLTVGKYVTPGRIDIDGNGIEPDFQNQPEMAEAERMLGQCALHLQQNGSPATVL